LRTIEITPFSHIGDYAPAFALAGTFEIKQPVVNVDGETTILRFMKRDKQPVCLDIDTHSGNFEYLSVGIPDPDDGRVFELGESFSIHLAQIMLDYYRNGPIEKYE
jgi:hypothetical protein